MSYPYPDDKGKTHYPECWRERGHHNCAVAEVERLRQDYAELLERWKEAKGGSGFNDGAA